MYIVYMWVVVELVASVISWHYICLCPQTMPGEVVCGDTSLFSWIASPLGLYIDGSLDYICSHDMSAGPLLIYKRMRAGLSPAVRCDFLYLRYRLR